MPSRPTIRGAPHTIVCCGGAALDRSYHAHAPLRFGTSNPVSSKLGFGGVARNVAEILARLGVATSLVTAVGDDEAGRALLRHCRELGIDTSHVVRSAQHATAEYAAILAPDGGLVVGLAAMAIFDALTVEALEPPWPHLASAAWVFADCNLPAPVLRALMAQRRGASFRLAVDAVSAPRSRASAKTCRGSTSWCSTGTRPAPSSAARPATPPPQPTWPQPSCGGAPRRPS
jgi:pseudouridine kinase